MIEIISDLLICLFIDFLNIVTINGSYSVFLRERCVSVVNF